jgi:hypothetical protein
MSVQSCPSVSGSGAPSVTAQSFGHTGFGALRSPYLSGQRGSQIGNQVIHVLDPNREPQQGIGHPKPLTLRR